VNLIDANGNSTPLEEISRLLDLDLQRQEAEALAARGNMTAIVRMLHNKSSQLMNGSLARDLHLFGWSHESTNFQPENAFVL
jgi:hypothetical protein